MLKIYLVRHGQNVDNANGILNGHRDEPLTEIGIHQAHEAADRIKEAGLVFDSIYMSPLVRASATAKIIAETISGPSPIELPLLIERDFGVMTGVEQNRIEELCAPDIFKTETINYFLNPKGAETFPELLQRAGKLITLITKTHHDGTVLLVTHGDFGKMIYAQYYNLDWMYVLEQFHFGNSELLLLSQDSEPDEAHVFTVTQHNS